MNHPLTTALVALPPRYVCETYAEALTRVPALSAFAFFVPSACAAEVFDLVDSLPGYQLVQIILSGLEPTSFVFRLTSPARPPVSMQTF